MKVSFLSLGIMIFFVYFETTRYMSVSMNSEMFIDIQKGSEKVLFF